MNINGNVVELCNELIELDKVISSKKEEINTLDKMVEMNRIKYQKSYFELQKTIKENHALKVENESIRNQIAHLTNENQLETPRDYTSFCSEEEALAMEQEIDRDYIEWDSFINDNHMDY